MRIAAYPVAAAGPAWRPVRPRRFVRAAAAAVAGCLIGAGATPRVTFGWVPVTLPDGGTLRQVVWVDCES